jgi:hypothetical protein
LGTRLIYGDYAKGLFNLNKKKAVSVTPLRFALKRFILALKDSALALVLSVVKKVKNVSKIGFHGIGSGVKFLQFFISCILDPVLEALGGHHFIGAFVY